ncbi:MAG: hypothetical protein HYU86_03010 [Chloroflexi bacterium]|nr:hypothetical protein [Chloroflexota bacterium]
MNFRLSLMKMLVWAIVGLIILGTVVFGVSVAVGSEDARYIATTITAIMATVLAGASLFVAIFQIQAHVRPFVTVARIQEVASLGPSGEAATIPYELDACYIEVQNTGSVPAEEIKLHISLLALASKEITTEVRTELPFLPPNGQETVEFPNIPREIQTNICAGQMKIEVAINYKGLGKRHDTEQSFNIERAEVRQVVGARSTFVFKHTNPSRLR